MGYPLAVLIAGLALSGCAQIHYLAFANCTAYDIRTSHMPWNPVHKMTICYDRNGAHYFPETGSTAGLSDVFSAPIQMTGKLINPTATP